MRILIIEDDKALAESLKIFLEKKGFAADTVFNGEDGEQRAELYGPDYDLIILDRMLPQKSGDEVLRALKEKGISVPVLMLTGKGSVQDRVDGLSMGADDYLIKPFDVSELLARVQAVLRRPKKVLPGILRVEDIELDPAKRRVQKGGREIKLTLKEFALLEYLMRNPDRALNREDMFNHVWDFASNALSNVIDVHMHNLRKKLGRDGVRIFETIPGIGYRLKASSERPVLMSPID